MAKITFIDPVTSLSGTLDEHSKIYYRTRNGRTHAYKINRPFAGEPSDDKENRKNLNLNVGRIIKCIRKNGTTVDEKQFTNIQNL